MGATGGRVKQVVHRISTATFSPTKKAPAETTSGMGAEQYGGGDALFWMLRDDQGPLGFFLAAENTSRYHGNRDPVMLFAVR